MRAHTHTHTYIHTHSCMLRTYTHKWAHIYTQADYIQAFLTHKTIMAVVLEYVI